MLLSFDDFFCLFTIFRYGNFEDILERMNTIEGGIEKMALGHEYFGAHVEQNNRFVMRQWAPGAQEMWLMGDFNDWNKFQYPFEKKEFGRWELTLGPNSQGECAIPHLSKIKLVRLKRFY